MVTIIKSLRAIFKFPTPPASPWELSKRVDWEQRVAMMDAIAKKVVEKKDMETFEFHHTDSTGRQLFVYLNGVVKMELVHRSMALTWTIPRSSSLETSLKDIRQEWDELYNFMSYEERILRMENLAKKVVATPSLPNFSLSFGDHCSLVYSHGVVNMNLVQSHLFPSYTWTVTSEKMEKRSLTIDDSSLQKLRIKLEDQWKQCDASNYMESYDTLRDMALRLLESKHVGRLHFHLDTADCKRSLQYLYLSESTPTVQVSVQYTSKPPKAPPSYEYQATCADFL